MNKRKKLSLLSIAVGVCLVFFSMYISDQVSEGRGQIQRGQKQVNTMKSLFNSNEYTAPVGDMATASGQKKINAGIAQADYYERVANWAMIGGIALIIIGAGGFIIPARRS